eukprot:g4625.t1
MAGDGATVEETWLTLVVVCLAIGFLGVGARYFYLAFYPPKDVVERGLTIEDLVEQEIREEILREQQKTRAAVAAAAQEVARNAAAAVEIFPPERDGKTTTTGSKAAGARVEVFKAAVRNIFTCGCCIRRSPQQHADADVVQGVAGAASKAPPGGSRKQDPEKAAVEMMDTNVEVMDTNVAEPELDDLQLALAKNMTTEETAVKGLLENLAAPGFTVHDLENQLAAVEQGKETAAPAASTSPQGGLGLMEVEDGGDHSPAGPKTSGTTSATPLPKLPPLPLKDRVDADQQPILGSDTPTSVVTSTVFTDRREQELEDWNERRLPIKGHYVLDEWAKREKEPVLDAPPAKLVNLNELEAMLGANLELDLVDRGPPSEDHPFLGTSGEIEEDDAVFYTEGKKVDVRMQLLNHGYYGSTQPTTPGAAPGGAHSGPALQLLMASTPTAGPSVTPLGTRGRDKKPLVFSVVSPGGNANADGGNHAPVGGVVQVSLSQSQVRSIPNTPAAGAGVASPKLGSLSRSSPAGGAGASLQHVPLKTSSNTPKMLQLTPSGVKQVDASGAAITPSTAKQMRQAFERQNSAGSCAARSDGGLSMALSVKDHVDDEVLAEHERRKVKMLIAEMSSPVGVALGLNAASGGTISGLRSLGGSAPRAVGGPLGLEDYRLTNSTPTAYKGPLLNAGAAAQKPNERESGDILSLGPRVGGGLLGANLSAAAAGGADSPSGLYSDASLFSGAQSVHSAQDTPTGKFGNTLATPRPGAATTDELLQRALGKLDDHALSLSTTEEKGQQDSSTTDAEMFSLNTFTSPNTTLTNDTASDTSNRFLAHPGTPDSVFYNYNMQPNLRNKKIEQEKLRLLNLQLAPEVTEDPQDPINRAGWSSCSYSTEFQRNSDAMGEARSWKLFARETHVNRCVRKMVENADTLLDIATTTRVLEEGFSAFGGGGSTVAGGDLEQDDLQLEMLALEEAAEDEAVAGWGEARGPAEEVGADSFEQEEDHGEPREPPDNPAMKMENLLARRNSVSEYLEDDIGARGRAAGQVHRRNTVRTIQDLVKYEDELAECVPPLSPSESVLASSWPVAVAKADAAGDVAVESRKPPAVDVRPIAAVNLSEMIQQNLESVARDTTNGTPRSARSAITGEPRRTGTMLITPRPTSARNMSLFAKIKMEEEDELAGAAAAPIPTHALLQQLAKETQDLVHEMRTLRSQEQAGAKDFADERMMKEKGKTRPAK